MYLTENNFHALTHAQARIKSVIDLGALIGAGTLMTTLKNE